jgi:hypothetical protein
MVNDALLYNNPELRVLVKERLKYDPTKSSGLVWKLCVGNGKVKVGQMAGGLDVTCGIYRLSINNKLYKAHNIVLILHDVTFKEGETGGHIDGNKLNNSIDNLQLVNQKKQIYNNRHRNKIMYNYTSWDKTIEKYKASYFDPVTWEFFLVGYFVDAYDAHKAACVHMQQHNPQLPCKNQPFLLSQP